MAERERAPHERNLYRNKHPDFKQLADAHPEFAPYVFVNKFGAPSIDWRDPDANRALTRVLLKHDFNLDWDMPRDQLCPPVTNRANYIHWLEDVLAQSGRMSGDPSVHGIDIGTGYSLIYPLLGVRIANWRFLATDIPPAGPPLREGAVEHARGLAARNGLEGRIEVRRAEAGALLAGVLREGEAFDFCMCNPPFFATPEDADASAKVAFVSRMVEESARLGTRVLWYSSMLGRKASLAPLRRALHARGVRNVRVTEFVQGRTTRWGLAWSHTDHGLDALLAAARVRPPHARPPSRPRRPQARREAPAGAERAAKRAARERGPGRRFVAAAASAAALLADAARAVASFDPGPAPRPPGRPPPAPPRPRPPRPSPAQGLLRVGPAEAPSTSGDGAEEIGPALPPALRPPAPSALSPGRKGTSGDPPEAPSAGHAGGAPDTPPGGREGAEGAGEEAGEAFTPSSAGSGGDGEEGSGGGGGGGATGPPGGREVAFCVQIMRSAPSTFLVEARPATAPAPAPAPPAEARGGQVAAEGGLEGEAASPRGARALGDLFEALRRKLAPAP
eukprot:tig00000842_g4880.t1